MLIREVCRVAECGRRNVEMHSVAPGRGSLCIAAACRPPPPSRIPSPTSRRVGESESRRAVRLPSASASRRRSISLWLKAMHAQVKRRLPGQRQHPATGRTPTARRPPRPPSLTQRDGRTNGRTDGQCHRTFQSPARLPRPTETSLMF